VPVYEYACTDCGEALEVRQSFTDDALTVCPACEGRLRKVLSAVGVVFKGSGFYRTDSRNGAAHSDGTGPSDGGSSAEKSSSSDASGASEKAGDSSQTSTTEKTKAAEKPGSTSQSTSPKPTTKTPA
jgi:putative FmdB family regulatory protein